MRLLSLTPIPTPVTWLTFFPRAAINCGCTRLYETLVTGGNDIRRKIIDFFVCLAVCHTVIPIRKKTPTHVDLTQSGESVASGGSVGVDVAGRNKRASSSLNSRVHPLDFVEGLEDSSTSQGPDVAPESASSIDYQVSIVLEGAGWWLCDKDWGGVCEAKGLGKQRGGSLHVPVGVGFGGACACHV